MTDEEIKDTALYKDCYGLVKKFPELAGDLAYLLREAYEGYRHGNWEWDRDLDAAFVWGSSPQRHDFWGAIMVGQLPKEYE